jgi:hypothetical protein
MDNLTTITEMKVLLFSLVIYLLGIAIILYVRPAIMFNRDGSWKEFGLGEENTTMFPIWMFCIIWAVLSYAICRFSFSEGTTHVVKTVAAATAAATVAETKPGYYKLNTNVMRKKGVPRYVYVGTELPAELDDDDA